MPPDFLGPLGTRDQTWNLRADDFIRANRPGLEALAITPGLVPSSREIALRLVPGATVGAVPLFAPDTHRLVGGIVVRPRFGWDDIGHLLQTVGWAAAPDVLPLPLVPGSAREVPAWVLAGPILRRLGALLREVRRGFRMHEEVRQQPRGSILWARYTAEQVVRGQFHLLPCRYPELGPDQLLRACLRWGIEQVHLALLPYANTDTVVRRLLREADLLLYELRDTPLRTPDHRILNRLLRHDGLPGEALRHGLQALGWLVDERGLAGLSASDGLAWRIPMHVLFERWVEHCVRRWAASFGGHVRTARTSDTTVPLPWTRRAASSLGSLAPDLVVQWGTHLAVFDAKYKGHFEELDQRRWDDLRENLRESHRHDIHQVLAYAALYDAPLIRAVLVYPMRPDTWARLAATGQTTATARLNRHGRELTLGLAALPLRIPPSLNDTALATSLNPFRLTA